MLNILSVLIPFHIVSALAPLHAGCKTLTAKLQCSVSGWLLSLVPRAPLIICKYIILSRPRDIGKRLLTQGKSIKRLTHSLELNPLFVLSCYSAVSFCRLFAAFPAQLERLAIGINKPNSIATLKGNYYETYSRSRRRGGGS